MSVLPSIKEGGTILFSHLTTYGGAYSDWVIGTTLSINRRLIDPSLDLDTPHKCYECTSLKPWMDYYRYFCD